MKYFHVLYNSSERGISNTGGFSIRSATTGTPEEYLKLLQTNSIFAYAPQGPRLMAADVMAAPEKVKEVEPSYFFTQLTTVEGKKLYVVGRKMYTGFDYPFFITGKASRLGNYAVDAYIFEDEVPAAEVFDLLYEQPAAGGAHFIPRDPSPRLDNEELKSICVGSNPEFPVEEKSFKSGAAHTIDARAYEILFAFVEAQKQNKTLYIKTNHADSAILMADFTRLLPASLLAKATFVTAHNAMAATPGFNIFVINELFTFPMMADQVMVLDLIAGDTINTNESGKFKVQVVNAVAENNFTSVHNTVAWICSPTYEQVKNLSAPTNIAIYNYNFEPEKFDDKLPAEMPELLGALAAQFAGKPESQKLLNERIEARFAKAATVRDVTDNIAYAKALNGINIDNIIAAHKAQFTNIVFASAESFDQFFVTEKKPENDAKFIDGSAYQQHNSYLTTLKSKWAQLYRYFIANYKTDREGLLLRMLNDDVISSAASVINIEFTDKEALIKTASALIAKAPEHEAVLVKIIIDAVKNGAGSSTDFFAKFGNKLDDERYTPLFIHQLGTSAPFASKDMVITFVDRLCDLAVHAKSAIVANNQIKQKIEAAYQQIINLLSNKQLSDDDFFGKILDPIKDSGVLDKDKEHKFARVSNILSNTTEEIDLPETMNVAISIKATAFLQLILPQTIAIKHDSVGKYIKTMVELGVAAPEYFIEHINEFIRKDDAIIYFVNSEKRKPLEIHQYLMDTFKMDSDAADKFMGNNYSEEFRKVLKSRQPSLWDKIKGFFSKPGKGKKGDDDADDEPGDNPVSARQSSKKKTKGKGKALSVIIAAALCAANVSAQDEDPQPVNEEPEVVTASYEEPTPEPVVEEVQEAPVEEVQEVVKPQQTKKSKKKTYEPKTYGNGHHKYYYVVNEGEKIPVYLNAPATQGDLKNLPIQFYLYGGDTLYFVGPDDPSTKYPEGWYSLEIDGTTYYFECYGKVTPYIDEEYDEPEIVDSPVSRKDAQHGAKVALLVLIGIGVVIWIIICCYSVSEGDYEFFGTTNSYGMRRKFFFNSEPYRGVILFCLGLLAIGIAAIVVMLLVGGVGWLLLQIVLLLCYAVAWIGIIMTILGILACFCGAIIPGVIAALIGGFIWYHYDGITEFGISCSHAGLAFFQALNIFSFCYDLVVEYWFEALMIACAPLALFLAFAVLWLLFAGILMLTESIITKRYGIKHPCPKCHQPSEPANYFSIGERGAYHAMPGNMRLHPNTYGLFHITHPVTGEEMPTLIFNGRDKLPRTCPHCGQMIKATEGTEKHIALIGSPSAGKSTLTYRFIANLMRRSDDVSFTDVDNSIKDTSMLDKIDAIKRSGYISEDNLPEKTGEDDYISTQLTIKRKVGMPYRLYINDVAGEFFDFRRDKTDEQMRYFENVESIIMLIDPDTTEFDESAIDGKFKKWMNSRESNLTKLELKDIYQTVDNVIDKHNTSKKNIHLNIVLVKTDLGYIDKEGMMDVKTFMQSQMGLNPLIVWANSFASTSYFAIAAMKKDSEQDITNLVDHIITDQLHISL